MMDTDGTLCVICADTTETVREMQRLHGTKKVVSAALGRLLTAASLMGSMLKGEKDSLTLKISSAGSLCHTHRSCCVPGKYMTMPRSPSEFKTVCIFQPGM